MKIKIWEMRTEKNITLEKLARRSGMSKSSINRYENEQQEVSIQKLEKIAKALNCKIEDLYESDY